MSQPRGATPDRSTALRPAPVGWQIIRLVMAALTLVALVTQFQSTVSHARLEAEPYASHLPTVIGNFFSFFTNQSTIAGITILIVGAVIALRTRAPEPRWLSVAFVCISVYEIITGGVYAALLRADGIGPAVVLWSNEVIHTATPIFFALDLLVAPGRRRLRWRAVWIIVAYPLAWMAFTVARSIGTTSVKTGLSPWFPYPFLDPAVQGGWGGVLVYVVALTAVIVTLGFTAVATTRLPWRSR